MKRSQKQSRIRVFFADDKRNIWMLYAAFALFNIILAFQYRAPFAYPDEYGVFAAGNWMLGGVDWAYKSNMYYGYTFSPFVGILLRLFHGIRPVYIGSLCVKALQVALIPALSYKFLHEVLETEDPLAKTLLSASVSLYPTLTLYAKYVSNETTLHVVMFICMYLIGKLAVGPSVSRTRIYSALLAFFAVFAYASHGMGLAFIAAVCLVVVVAHIGTKKSLVSYPFFIGSLAVSYFLDAQIKATIMDAVYWTPEGGELANTFASSLPRLLDMLTAPGFVSGFFGILTSRLLYISAATFGLFWLAVIILLVFVFRFVRARFTGTGDPRNNVMFIAAIFGLAIFLCGIGLSTLGNVPEPGTASRMYFYGRYYEYTALPMLLIGLHRVFNRDVKKMELLMYLIATFMCYLILSIYVHFQVMPFVSDELNRFFILGILPFIGNVPSEYADIIAQDIPIFDLFALWLVTVSVFLVTVWLLKSRHRLWSLVLLAVMFSYAIYVDNTTAVMPLSVANYDYFYSKMEPIEAALGTFRDVYQQHPNLYVVTNQLGADSSWSSLVRGRAQLSFVDYSVTQIIAPGEIDGVEDAETRFQNAIIVSDQNLEYFGADEAYLKIYESSNACIWIRGEEIRAYYDNRET